MKSTNRRKSRYTTGLRGSASDSLRQLLRSPLTLFFNVLLIAIAITLPIVLDLSVQNLKNWAGYNDNDLEITLYLKPSTTESQGISLSEKIKAWPGVDRAKYVSKEDALNQLRKVELFEGALKGLIENPLPANIVIILPHDSSIKALATDLVAQAKALPAVDWVLFDLDWFNKADALIGVGAKVNAALTAFLSFTVCLVIGNTVRMTINQKREEILVSKLVGATDAYVRRPFLLMGMWIGVLGAITGLLLCSVLWWLLGHQLGDLSLAYGGDIQLAGIAPIKALAITLSCAFFGFIGAWAICNRQLYEITPE